MWRQAIGWTLLFLMGLFVLTGLLGLGVARWYVGQLAKTSGYSWSELSQVIPRSPAASLERPHTILILGTDGLANRAGHPELTDTMILLSLDVGGQVNLVSLPRDIWISQYQTKINTLYTYAQQVSSESARQLVANQLEEVFEVPIDYPLVISLDSLASLIDMLGGLEINIPIAFKDDQFPRTDVPINAKDPTVLYKTVEFQSGMQRLTGEQATEYIRSRHASGSAGTDTDRSRRQQEVVSALVGQLLQPSLITKPQAVGQLLSWYRQYMDQQLPLAQVAQLAAGIWPVEKVALTTHDLTEYPANPDGVLWHPPINRNKYQGQWVYLIRDQSNFNQQLRQFLKLERQP